MNKLDISTILASAIHESKNHVGNILYQLQNLKQHISSDQGMSALQNIEEGLKQVNDEWVEYLYLYRLSSNGYSLHYDCWSLEEFLDDQVFALHPAATAKGLNLTFDVDSGLNGVYDERLMTAVLSTAVYNALRFAKSSIQLQCERQGEFLAFYIDDDGPGFSDDIVTEEDPFKSSTGLGLFFAELAANSHQAGNARGYLERLQSPTLGGARLAIYVPQ